MPCQQGSVYSMVELDTARCADLSVILDPNLDPTGGIFGTTGSYKMEQTPVVLPENPHQMTLSNTRAYKAARFFQSVTIETPMPPTKVTMFNGIKGLCLESPQQRPDESKQRRAQPRGSTCAHLLRMRASSSRLARATGGKLSRRDQGLQASITTRALRGSSPPYAIGSSAVLQQPRKISMSSRGSKRVHIAHTT